MLYENWKKALNGIKRPWPKGARWIVISQTPQFGRTLQSQLPHQIATTWTFDQISAQLPREPQKDEHILVTITRPEQWKWILAWPNPIKKKTLALILTDVSLKNPAELPSWNIELFHPHRGLPIKIKQLLSSQIPSTERS